MSMEEKEKVIEPAVLDERGQIIQANETPTWNDPGDHARPQGDTRGILSGFFVFLFGFTVTVAVLLFSICILLPLALIGRLFSYSGQTKK